MGILGMVWSDALEGIRIFETGKISFWGMVFHTNSNNVLPRLTYFQNTKKYHSLVHIQYYAMIKMGCEMFSKS